MSYIDHIVLNNNNQVDIISKPIANSIVSAYDSSTLYHIGDLVFYEGILYECLMEFSSSEQWDSTHWKTITVKDKINNLENFTQKSNENIFGALPLTWIKGGIYSSTGLDYFNPNMKTDFISVTNSKPYYIINPSSKIVWIYQYVSKSQFISRTQYTKKNIYFNTSSTTHFIRLMIQSNPSNIQDIYDINIINLYGGKSIKIGGEISSGDFSALSEVPLGTMFSIPASVLNAMSDTPNPYGSSGGNIFTLGGANQIRNGSVQIILYWSGEVYYRSYNTAYQPWNKFVIKGKQEGRYPIALGYFTDNSIYPSLSDIPNNTFSSFSRIAYNNMTDCPYQNETGVFIENYSPNADTKNGGIQKIASWNGNFEATRSYVDNAWREWHIIEHTDEKIYTVGAAGTGKDFSSLVLALQMLNNKVPSKVHKYKLLIDEGTYNVSGIADLVVAGTINNAGFILPPNTEIIGKGKNKTIITFEYAGSNDTVMSQTSPINIPYTGKLKNLSIIVKNVRYAVHTDTDVKSLGEQFINNNILEFENVSLEHKGFDTGLSPTYKAPAAFGMGIWSGQKRIFKDCDFIGNHYCGWLTHNRIVFKDPGLLDFENCTFINNQTDVPQFNCEKSGAAFISWGAPVKSIIRMRNCFSNRPIVLYPNASSPTGISCDYYGYFDNDIFVMESNNENAHKLDNYITGTCVKRIVSGNSNVQAYTPVEYNIINDCNSNFTGLYQKGIALHDAEVGKSCIIQTKGVIYSPWIDLHASAVGKSYNWNGSNWVETSDQHPFIKVVQERVAIINP